MIYFLGKASGGILNSGGLLLIPLDLSPQNLAEHQIYFGIPRLHPMLLYENLWWSQVPGSSSVSLVIT